MSRLDSTPASIGGASQPKKAGGNVFTVLLILSFIALVTGCVFLGLELKALDPSASLFG